MYEYKARVTGVVDGDTYDVDVDEMYRMEQNAMAMAVRESDYAEGE